MESSYSAEYEERLDQQQQHTTIDLFAQKLLIDRIHVKKPTDNADMLMVWKRWHQEVLVKADKFDSVVVRSRDTDVLVALLHHLNCDMDKNVIIETKKDFFYHKWNSWATEFCNAKVSTIRTHCFRMRHSLSDVWRFGGLTYI